MKSKKPEYRTVWRDAKNRFAKAPKGKRIPKGWKVIKIPIVRRVLTEQEKRDRKYSQEHKKFKVGLRTKQKSVKFSQLSVDKERHLRFRKGGGQWIKKVPKLRTKVQIGIFEGNKFISFWKSVHERTYTKEISSLIKKDRETVRFPQKSRVEFPLIGDTWRDALSVISLKGLKYNCRMFYEFHFTGEVNGKREKFQKRSFIDFRQMYGMTYDEYLQNILEKGVRSLCNQRNKVFTSEEKLIQFAEQNSLEDGGNFWEEWLEDKLENYDRITKVRGSFYGWIAE